LLECLIFVLLGSKRLFVPSLLHFWSNIKYSCTFSSNKDTLPLKIRSHPIYICKRGGNLYTVKKGYPVPSPAGMSLTKVWPGIIKLFPARESLVIDIPAEDGKNDNLFLHCKSRQKTSCKNLMCKIVSRSDMEQILDFREKNWRKIFQCLKLLVSDILYLYPCYIKKIHHYCSEHLLCI
jgi:hypothetical protein